MTNWQPIETCPKSSRLILVANRERVWIADWVHAYGATHWMPLPDPPSVGETPDREPASLRKYPNDLDGIETGEPPETAG